MESLLYEIEPLDPLVFASVGAVLLLVSGVAVLRPALNASRTDVVDALRCE